jgi:hypothetical protein
MPKPYDFFLTLSLTAVDVFTLTYFKRPEVKIVFNIQLFHAKYLLKSLLPKKEFERLI